MEYPSMIQIETTNLCNAACDFCLVPTRKRIKGIMSDELFKKIIDDCKQFPIKKICPFSHGEPFVDYKFLDRLKYINQQLPEVHFDIFSNMELAGEEKIKELQKIKNIDAFVMSISGYDKESIYRHQKTDWDKVYKNVLNLIDINNKNKFIEKLQVVAMSYNKEEMEKIRQIWDNKHGLFKFFFTTQQNWLGDFTSSIIPNLNKICLRTTHLNIFFDGIVPLCCWDVEGKYAIGDIKINSILEIYNNNIYTKYRRNLKRDLIPCNKCTE